MIKDKSFTAAIFISIAIHTAFLFNWPLPNRVFFKTRPHTKLEVTYYNIKDFAKLLDNFTQTVAQKTSADNLDKKAGLMVKGQGLGKSDKKIILTQKRESLLAKGLLFDKKTKLESEKIIKDIFNVPKPVITDLKSDINSKRVGYAGYYRMVREKIRKAAVINQPKNFQEGQVCLAFSVSKDGTLENVTVVSSKSLASELLKAVALKSVRDAAPFAPIPSELNQDSVNFSLTISFILEK